ncbi:MAG: cobalamin-dependent protein [Dehalococcoidia bacterium]|nr:cobalamin-dependent protein [Dehalococcoidia bacterium]
MEKDRRIRLLLVRNPFDGHVSGYNVVATRLRDEGIEVILGGALFAEQIADTAIQEDADFIGYRIMAGDGPVLVEQLLQILKDKDADIPIIVGGVIPAENKPRLKAMGVVDVFGPGSTAASMVSCMKDHMCCRK